MALIGPKTILTFVNLAKEGTYSTRVTVTWEAFGDVTTDEIAAFVKERSGMTQGWTGSFNKLEELLNSK
jgi:hypothetical protein